MQNHPDGQVFNVSIQKGRSFLHQDFDSQTLSTYASVEGGIRHIAADYDSYFDPCLSHSGSGGYSGGSSNSNDKSGESSDGSAVICPSPDEPLKVEIGKSSSRRQRQMHAADAANGDKAYQASLDVLTRIFDGIGAENSNDVCNMLIKSLRSVVSEDAMAEQQQHPQQQHRQEADQELLHLLNRKQAEFEALRMQQLQQQQADMVNNVVLQAAYYNAMAMSVNEAAAWHQYHELKRLHQLQQSETPSQNVQAHNLQQADVAQAGYLMVSASSDGKLHSSEASEHTVTANDSTETPESVGPSLRVILQDLHAVDERRVLIARKINHLGFVSAKLLTDHFSQYGEVERVLLANNNRAKRTKSASTSRVRPAGLGFIVMEKVEQAQAILAAGTQHGVCKGRGRGHEVVTICVAAFSQGSVVS